MLSASATVQSAPPTRLAANTRHRAQVFKEAQAWGLVALGLVALGLVALGLVAQGLVAPDSRCPGT